MAKLRIWFWTTTLSIVAAVLRPWCWVNAGDSFNYAERAYLWVATHALNAEEAARG